MAYPNKIVCVYLRCVVNCNLEHSEIPDTRDLDSRKSSDETGSSSRRTTSDKSVICIHQQQRKQQQHPQQPETSSDSLVDIGVDQMLVCRRLSAEDARRGALPRTKNKREEGEEEEEAGADRRRGSLTREKAERRSSVGLLVAGSPSGYATPVRRVSAQELYGLSGELE